MTLQELAGRLKEKKEVVSVVGAGGKSSLIAWLVSHLAAGGKKVLVTTTTHIYVPESQVFASDMDEVQERWAQGNYAVIGQPEAGTGKLCVPPEKLLTECMKLADVVLIEADGSRRMPCKIPAVHEPVIRPETTLVIGVVGLSCLGQRLRDCCFRWELFSERSEGGNAVFSSGICSVTGEERMTEALLAQLLASPQGTRKNVGNLPYLVVLNQCDSVDLAEAAAQIEALLKENGVSEVISVCLKKENGKDENGNG